MFWIGTIGNRRILSRRAMRYHGAVQLCYLTDLLRLAVPLCPCALCPSPGSPHPCLHCIPTGAGSDAFRWMSRTLEPTNTTFSLSVISQFCAVVFQLLTSRRVRLKVTVLASPGSSSTSSKPRRTPQGLSSPPSWTYWCVCAVSVQPAERWWIQGPCSYVNVPAAGSRSP